MDYQKVINKISSTILANVNKAIAKANFDVTFRGKIKKNLGNGRYQVERNGVNYIVKSDGSYNVDDLVYVCAPMNRWEDLFFLNDVIAKSS